MRTTRIEISVVVNIQFSCCFKSPPVLCLRNKLSCPNHPLRSLCSGNSFSSLQMSPLWEAPAVSLSVQMCSQCLLAPKTNHPLHPPSITSSPSFPPSSGFFFPCIPPLAPLCKCHHCGLLSVITLKRYLLFLLLEYCVQVKQGILHILCCLLNKTLMIQVTDIGLPEILVYIGISICVDNM